MPVVYFLQLSQVLEVYRQILEHLLEVQPEGPAPGGVDGGAPPQGPELDRAVCWNPEKTSFCD